MKFHVSFLGYVFINEFEFSRLILYIGYKLHHLYANFVLQINLFYAKWSSGLNATQDTLISRETLLNAA